MNEKIKELAEQAEDYVESLGLVPDYWQAYSEKFAELIVKECAEVVSNQYSEDWGKWSNKMILEHFGVKE